MTHVHRHRQLAGNAAGEPSPWPFFLVLGGVGLWVLWSATR